MLVIDCATHARRVLLPASRIRSLRNTDLGIWVEVECWCGTRTTLRTGRQTAGDAPGHGSNL